MEAAAIEGLRGKLDERFGKAVDLLMAARGKVIVSGMGKSGLIARKISETGGTVKDAAESVLAGADHESDPGVGPIQVLRQP